MYLQRVTKTEFDLPKMHYSPVRNIEATRWTMVHLGEVEFGKFDPRAKGGSSVTNLVGGRMRTRRKREVCNCLHT